MQLTSRLEGLEELLTKVHAYVEKVAANHTDNTNLPGRTNPGKKTMGKPDLEEITDLEDFE